MIALAEELGLRRRAALPPVGAASSSTARCTLQRHRRLRCASRRCRPLGARAPGWFVAQCQLRARLRRARGHPAGALAAAPLRRARSCERIWRPLLDSRFDGDHDELPATYLWARTSRMRGARDRAGARRGRWATSIGGHQRLIEAARPRARASSGSRSASARRRRGPRVDDGGAVTGVRVDGDDEPFDLTIATLQPPALRLLLPDDAAPAARRLPAALPRRRLPDPQGARARCCPTTRSTSASRRRSPPWSRPRTSSAPSTPTACASSTCRSTARRARPSIRGRRRRSTRASRPCSRGSRPTSATRTSSTGPCSARRWSSRCTLGARRPRMAPIWPGVDGLGAGLRQPGLSAPAQRRLDRAARRGRRRAGRRALGLWRAWLSRSSTWRARCWPRPAPR